MNNYLEEKKSFRIFGISIKVWLLIILLCLFFGLLLYKANFSYKNTKEVVEREELGANISLDYDSDTNIYSISDMLPTKDYLGKSSGIDQYFDFSVNVHLKQASKIHYELSIKKDSTTLLKDDEVRIYLEKKNPDTDMYEPVLEPSSFIPLKATTDIGTPKGYMVLYEALDDKSQKDYYRLRIWLSENSLATTNSYSVAVILNAIAE